MSKEHEHHYEYSGVVYTLGGKRPGSGAREVLYYDRYFCSACLDCVYHRLPTTSDSYGAVLFNATPAPNGAKLP